ncbi:unnamed protein product [Angiostrongylus costaricensis]|uniref:Uncharacterized protein n=1 Tax=Angiostrongylus costaricensis TaxID=334426 RepID=A0A0R3PV70_ANGCS|nr:unnamed protein product [Angiostrongylus costaricensis]
MINNDAFIYFVTHKSCSQQMPTTAPRRRWQNQFAFAFRHSATPSPLSPRLRCPLRSLHLGLVSFFHSKLYLYLPGSQSDLGRIAEYYSI